MNDQIEVKIREVAPRDGFQSWPDFIPTETKLKVINAVIAAGIKNIETTSFVSPKAIPQMKDASELMALAPRNGIRHSALVPNLKGAQLAAKAGVDDLVVVISASDEHNKANVRRTIDESVADLDDIFGVARENNITISGTIAVAFGCPYLGDVPIDSVLRLADEYTSRGAEALILGDTTGMATPPRAENMARALLERYPGKDICFHFHNNRGTAMASLYASLQAGIRTFDTSLGGIGGCPNVPQAAGNLPTEDVVYMLEDMGVKTSINLKAVIEAALLLEKELGRVLPGQVMKSGPRLPEEIDGLRGNCGIG